MSEQSPKDLGAPANLRLAITVLLAIVGTGLVVLPYALTDQRSRGEVAQIVAPAAALTPPFGSR